MKGFHWYNRKYQSTNYFATALNLINGIQNFWENSENSEYSENVHHDILPHLR